MGCSGRSRRGTLVTSAKQAPVWKRGLEKASLVKCVELPCPDGMHGSVLGGG